MALTDQGGRCNGSKQEVRRSRRSRATSPCLLPAALAVVLAVVAWRPLGFLTSGDAGSSRSRVTPSIDRLTSDVGHPTYVGHSRGDSWRTGMERASLMARSAVTDAEAPSVGTRVGLLTIPGGKADAFKDALTKLKFNVSNETFFQTEIPDPLQIPVAAKFLAMSQTVDVMIAAHGAPQAAVELELLRAYQSVALNTNVPIIPCNLAADVDKVVDIAIQMGEIRQQALLGGGKRKAFFGLGKNASSEDDKEKKPGKIYF